MRKIFTISILLFTVLSFGQDVKKKKENTRNGKATYYVRKSDMKTKHGEYKIKAYSGSAILVSGTYSNGKKEGLWTERYYSKGRNLKSSGNYQNDKKIGKWIFYNMQGEIVQEYDFNKNELITSTECGDELEYDVYLDNELTKIKLDCPPSYIGGKEFLTYELTQKITASFPFKINEKGRANIKFNNVISFFIDKNGNVENVEFKDKVENSELEKFIRDLIKERKGEWIAGKLNNEKVKAKMKIGIGFRLMY